MASEGQLRRIGRLVGIDDLAARLAGLQTADLHAVLLDVASRRAGALKPGDVLRQYEAADTLQPAPHAPHAYRELEGAAMALLPPGFVELALAPAAPLGASSVLARFSQDRAVSTIAGTELVSDSTNVLALECARRRRPPASRRHEPPTRLAASHRMFRPRERAHFGLIALCTAGRDRGSFAMQLDALREHLDWHVRVLCAHAPTLRLAVSLTDLSDGSRRETLANDVIAPMRTAWKDVTWAFDDERQAGRGYYADVAFAIDALGPDGSRLNLCDGGFTDWTARLLADAKERLLISGLGSERLLGQSASTRSA